MTGRIKHRIEGLHGDTPVIIAAHRAIQSRLGEVDRLLRRLRKGEDDPEDVHQLRVATRRTSAALRVFGRFCNGKSRKRLAGALREVRRAASTARRDDVHLDRLRADRGEAPAELLPAFDLVVSRVAHSRETAQELVQTVSRSKRAAFVRGLGAQVLCSIHDPLRDTASGTSRPAWRGTGRPYNLRELAASELPAIGARVLEAAGGDLSDPAAVHQLRVAGKKLRYALELLAEGVAQDVAEGAYDYLETLQERGGELNDLAEIADVIAAMRAAPQAVGQHGSPDSPENRNDRGAQNPQAADAAPSGELQRLQERYRALRDAKHRDLLAWLEAHQPGAVIERLTAALAQAGQGQGCESGARDGRRNGRHTGPMHRRIAAIDVGTNSVRLVVAETDPTKGFHIVEDIKETTRLGAGVYTTGQLQPGAIEKTLTALEHMRTVAAAKNVEQIRAVGTSAVREAANRAEFLESALWRTGIDIEVLDADSEARLAFSSVVNGFDLDDRCVAVADIGGGSTELVLSTSGVIDDVYPLPLGAVRLTDLYGAGGAKGEYRYDEMAQAVTRVISERLYNTRHRPFQIIGTGGTFTSLARLANYREPAGGGALRFSFAVGGYEFRRAQVTRLLDWLRSTPLDERKRLPGLSSARAEIIVAGVCIVEKLMQYFGVDRLRVHDGGIRDGLLLQMVDAMGVHIEHPRARGPETIESVRRLAERCEYEAAHSDHVAFLSMRIFDQLAQQGLDLAAVWTRLDHRMLLHAAAVLHDVGMLFGRPRHHRHSYDLIVHGDLPTLTRREVEIIANISRYHRRRGPSRKDPSFRRLGDDDQHLVAHLAGILRVADGLDRSHDQRVSDVLVEVAGDEVVFRAVAAERPEEDLRAAKKKADVFQAAFQTHARTEWLPASATFAPSRLEREYERT